MSDTLQRIIDGGVVAIIRASSSAELLDVAKALAKGGITALEVTMTTPDALRTIRDIARQIPELVVGVGTVLDSETARSAILTGAEFVVSPITDEATIKLCRRYNIVSCPGAFTPTEIFRAWEMGADLVKVFPATTLGPQYIKDIRAPIPYLKLVPTGGVSVENAGDFIRAGAVALAAGGKLVDKKAIAERKLDLITETAQKMIAEVTKARQELKS